MGNKQNIHFFLAFPFFSYGLNEQKEGMVYGASVSRGAKYRTKWKSRGKKWINRQIMRRKTVSFFFSDFWIMEGSMSVETSNGSAYAMQGEISSKPTNLVGEETCHSQEGGINW